MNSNGSIPVTAIQAHGIWAPGIVLMRSVNFKAKAR